MPGYQYRGKEVAKLKVEEKQTTGQLQNLKTLVKARRKQRDAALAKLRLLTAEYEQYTALIQDAGYQAARVFYGREFEHGVERRVREQGLRDAEIHGYRHWTERRTA